jgi:hypothetical protein
MSRPKSPLKARHREDPLTAMITLELKAGWGAKRCLAPWRLVEQWSRRALTRLLAATAACLRSQTSWWRFLGRSKPGHRPHSSSGPSYGAAPRHSNRFELDTGSAERCSASAWSASLRAGSCSDEINRAFMGRTCVGLLGEPNWGGACDSGSAVNFCTTRRCLPTP